MLRKMLAGGTYQYSEVWAWVKKWGWVMAWVFLEVRTCNQTTTWAIWRGRNLHSLHSNPCIGNSQFLPGLCGGICRGVPISQISFEKLNFGWWKMALLRAFVFAFAVVFVLRAHSVEADLKFVFWENFKTLYRGDLQTSWDGIQAHHFCYWGRLFSRLPSQHLKESFNTQCMILHRMCNFTFILWF